MKKAVILLALAAVAVLSFSGIFDNEAMYGRIHADAQGYYGYLIAIIVEQSFEWDKVIQPYADAYFNGGGADFTVQSEYGRINKYYSGTAILILPFFLVTCLFAWLFGFPIDGYSEPFQTGIMFAALFYTGVGLFYLSRFLESRGVSKNISLLTVLFLLFATGLFHYSIAEPAMSHAYSFGLVCMFMYRVDKWLTASHRTDFVWASVVFGLIVLVRPVNGLVLFSVPFIAGGTGALWNKLKEKERLVTTLSVGVLLLFGVLLFQSLMYLAQVGKPLVWSYQNEGFNFLKPQVLNVLFSYKKGFFVYTPIALLGAIGLLVFLFKKPQKGLLLWSFLALVVYVISCWWNWYYGASFGHRAMIEYLPFFGFGLAFLLQYVSKLPRIILVGLCLVFVSVNLIQEYQYQKFILHWVGMDEARYWEVFLKTDRKYDGIFYRRDMTLSTETFETDLELDSVWGSQGLDSTKAFSGNWSTAVGAGNVYGSTMGIPVEMLGAEGSRQVHFSARVWCEKPMQELNLAYSFRNDTMDYGHTYIQLGQLITESEKWIEINKIETLIKPQSATDTWVIYPFSEGPTKVYLDDIRYEIITLKE